MRGVALASLRQSLKAECGYNLTAGVAVADDLRLNQLLSDKQQWYSSSYDWPFLKTRIDVATNAAQRFYYLPVFNTDRPYWMKNLWSNIWRDMMYGITEDDYNELNSLTGQTVDPVQKWMLVDQSQMQPGNPLGAVVNTGVTGLTGVYSYAYSYVFAVGGVTYETELSPVSAPVTVANQGIDVSPVPDAPVITAQGVNLAQVVTFKNVYRTTAGGSTYFFRIQFAQGTPGGITGDNAADSTLGNAWPLVSGTMNQVAVFELWPIPATASTVRFTCQRALDPLVLDTDTADLDDILLVKSVAADDLLKRAQPQYSQLKGNEAQARLAMLMGAGPTMNRSFRIGGGEHIDKRYARRVLTA